MVLMGFLGKKKRGAVLQRSFDAACAAITKHKYYSYVEQGGTAILLPKIDFADGTMVQQKPRPKLLLPGYNGDVLESYLRYINIGAINPKRRYPDLILNRPIPFNHPLLRNRMLEVGVNVPL